MGISKYCSKRLADAKSSSISGCYDVGYNCEKFIKLNGILGAIAFL